MLLLPLCAVVIEFIFVISVSGLCSADNALHSPQSYLVGASVIGLIDATHWLSSFDYIGDSCWIIAHVMIAMITLCDTIWCVIGMLCIKNLSKHC